MRDDTGKLRAAYRDEHNILFDPPYPALVGATQIQPLTVTTLPAVVQKVNELVAMVNRILTALEN